MGDKDKKKTKKSKEEIAREFDLPERKSKIATIMKQDDQAYCLCRSSDCSRFMICCDGCEEWYHGDCINISEKEAKHIKHYYCQRCKEIDSSLQTVFRIVPAEKKSGTSGHANKGPTTTGRKKKATTTTSSAKAARSTSTASTLPRCGKCEGCQRPNCRMCEGCLSRKIGRKPRCEQKICLHQKKKEKQTSTRLRKRKRSVSPEVVGNPDLEGLRQCLGPSCRFNARPQSKYCSDECGMKLATNRIFQVLPQRIQEWTLTSCHAEEENKKQLENIRKKQAMVNHTLGQLDERHAELDLLVERAKNCALDPKALEGCDGEDESIYCITCGHEIHSRTAIRHMEKCFNKYESQASFGSVFKTRIDEKSMFCDFFNPASRTYCKRLRVLCPEHSKDPKVLETDVCGCPLIKDVFTLTGESCRAPKKSCFRHYVWEKIRRAEIDLERVRQWLKMDDLLEEERQIRASMTSRAGVLNLMLHSTYNHEVNDEMYGITELKEEKIEPGESDLNLPIKSLFPTLQKDNLFYISNNPLTQSINFPNQKSFFLKSEIKDEI